MPNPLMSVPAASAAPTVFLPSQLAIPQELNNHVSREEVVELMVEKHVEACKSQLDGAEAAYKVLAEQVRTQGERLYRVALQVIETAVREELEPVREMLGRTRKVTALGRRADKHRVDFNLSAGRRGGDGACALACTPTTHNYSGYREDKRPNTLEDVLTSAAQVSAPGFAGHRVDPLPETFRDYWAFSVVNDSDAMGRTYDTEMAFPFYFNTGEVLEHVKDELDALRPTMLLCIEAYRRWTAIAEEVSEANRPALKRRLYTAWTQAILEGQGIKDVLVAASASVGEGAGAPTEGSTP